MDRWRRITGVKSLVDRIVKWLIVATVPPLLGRRAEDGAEERPATTVGMTEWARAS